jgi:hypothetical protein
VLASVFPSALYATAIVLRGAGSNGQYRPLTRRSASSSAHRRIRPSHRARVVARSFAFRVLARASSRRGVRSTSRVVANRSPSSSSSSSSFAAD